MPVTKNNVVADRVAERLFESEDEAETGRGRGPLEGPTLPDLLDRYEKAGGRYLVCPICFDSRKLDKAHLLANAEIGGTVPLWQWIGDEGATTFSY